jgi:penicillin-binding protein 1A
MKTMFTDLKASWLAWSWVGRIWRLGLLGLVFGLLGALAGGIYFFKIWNDTPPLSSLEEKVSGSNSTLYSDSGRRLGIIQSDSLRQPIDKERIPKVVADATVAIEDARFYTHEGLDFVGIMRATMANLGAGETVEGGSTISQQVVKNLYLSKEQTLKRKVQEARLASTLEEERAKSDILALYLNNVPYGTVEGQNATGIQAAARTFYGVGAQDLELHQAALLAGLPQSPSALNPFDNPIDARERRDQVLDAMVKYGSISDIQALEAKRKDLGVEKQDFYTDQRATYFFDYVKQELIERYGKEKVEKGGLQVYTTLDLDRQKEAQKAIKDQLDGKKDPAGAVVSINPENGEIKAMVTNEPGDKANSFNVAASGERQPGSTVKPLVLAAAVSEEDADLKKTLYKSKKLDIESEKYGDFKVETYSGEYPGKISLNRATLLSDNTVYAQLILDLGPERVSNFMERLGISSELEGVPAEGLGGFREGVTPLNLTQTYATLASGGVLRSPSSIRRVIFPDGEKDDWDDEEPAERVVEESVTGVISDVLEENIIKGTGKAAQLQCLEGSVAGKTGTTDDFKDAWFAGYTGNLATVVWVGYPKPRPMTDVQGVQVSGSSFPASIWGDYMNQAMGGECGELPGVGETDLEAYCGERSVTKDCPGKDGDRDEEEESDDRQPEERQDRKDSTGDPSEREESQPEERQQPEEEEDSTEPVRLTGSPDKTTSETTARFSFEGDGELECRLDGEAWKSCNSGSVTYRGLESGEHQFAVRGVQEGRTTRANYTWTVRSESSQ